MTGPEHYREADRILAVAKDADPDANRDDVALLLKFAEVHATLALAAATAEAGDLTTRGGVDALGRPASPWAHVLDGGER
jgi:hypothetical protein